MCLEIKYNNFTLHILIRILFVLLTNSIWVWSGLVSIIDMAGPRIPPGGIKDLYIQPLTIFYFLSINLNSFLSSSYRHYHWCGFNWDTWLGMKILLTKSVRKGTIFHSGCFGFDTLRFTYIHWYWFNNSNNTWWRQIKTNYFWKFPGASGGHWWE